MSDFQSRPVYRHLVVQRRDLVEHVDVDQLRRLRLQMESGQAISEDLQHLVVKDTLRKTVRKALAWAGHGKTEVEVSSTGLDASAVFAEASKMAERGEKSPIGYQPQEGVIVSRILHEQFPGGGAIPSQPTYLSHPGFDTGGDRQAEYMRCALELLGQFEAHSDRQFLLMDPAMRAGVTLVTLVLTPIVAVPRADVGVELLCEFSQKTQFGFVGAEGFEVFSEIGEYPIQVPSDGDMMSMFTTVEQFRATDAALTGLE